MGIDLSTTSVRPSESSRFRFPALLTTVFLIIAGVGALNHEFWRDEMQAWLIARDVPNLAALFEQVHYEGAPPLWSLLLRALTLITHRPEIVQVLTWLLAGATVFMITAFAPFNRLQKTLIVGNYYLLFEYGTVCRNYLPGVLGLMLACALYPSARRHPWAFTGALLVAVMASVHSLIVAVAVAAAFWGGAILRRVRGSASSDAAAEPLNLFPLVVFGVGLAVAVISVSPRPDTFYGPAHGWSLDWNPTRWAKISWAFVWSQFPLPRPPGFFWIPPWDTPFPSFKPEVALLLAGALFGGGVFFLRRHTEALLCYLVGTLGLAAFFYTKYLGFPRHTGFLFLTLFVALWVKQVTDRAGATAAGSRWPGRIAGGVFTCMLAFQAVSGLAAVREDYRRFFSCGKPAAAFIKERGLENAFIAVGPDWAGSPLAGYLNRTLYYPQGRRYGSFTRWDFRRNEEINDPEFLRRAFAEARGREMVIASDHPFADDLLQQNGLSLLGHIGGSLTPFEDYYLFLAAAKPGASPALAPNPR